MIRNSLLMKCLSFSSFLPPSYFPPICKTLCVCVCVCVYVCELLSCVQLFATSWTIGHQAPLSMRFSRQGYWSGLPFCSPRNTVRAQCIFGVMHTIY